MAIDGGPLAETVYALVILGAHVSINAAGQHRLGRVDTSAGRVAGIDGTLIVVVAIHLKAFALRQLADGVERTQVGVIAGCAIGLGCALTSVDWVAEVLGAQDAIVAGQLPATLTRPFTALIREGADAPIITGQRIGHIGTARSRNAGVIRARVVIIAVGDRSARTLAKRALFIACTRVIVRAGAHGIGCDAAHIRIARVVRARVFIVTTLLIDGAVAIVVRAVAYLRGKGINVGQRRLAIQRVGDPIVVVVRITHVPQPVEIDVQLLRIGDHGTVVVFIQVFVVVIVRIDAVRQPVLVRVRIPVVDGAVTVVVDPIAEIDFWRLSLALGLQPIAHHFANTHAELVGNIACAPDMFIDGTVTVVVFTVAVLRDRGRTLTGA